MFQASTARSLRSTRSDAVVQESEEVQVCGLILILLQLVYLCSYLYMAAIVVRIRTIGPIRTICPKWSDFQ